VLSLAFARRICFTSPSLRFVRSTAALFGTILLALALFGFPALARLFPTTQLLEKAKPYLSAQTDIAAYEYAEPSLVWYFRRYVHGFLQGLYPNNIQPYMNTPGPRLVILPSRYVAQFFPILPPDTRSFAIRGFDLVKGKWVELTVIIRPPAE
jgi:hypothetical protein